MIDLQTVLTYLTLISIPVGVAYHIMTLNNTRKNQHMTLETRQAQMFLTIYNRILEENFARTRYNIEWVWSWSDFEDFRKKYGPESENWPNFVRVMMFLEGIGILLKKGMISASFIDDFISGTTVRIWEKYSEVVFDIRKYYDSPQAYEWVEYLYDEVKAIYNKQHPELTLNR
jgi:hypothetical protein